MWNFFKSHFNAMSRLVAASVSDNALLVIANAPYGPDEELKVITIADLRTALGLSSSGLQIMRYTTSTPANPSNLNLPALAYDPSGSNPTYIWDVTNQAWV
jgi:hypothetical protein